MLFYSRVRFDLPKKRALRVARGLKANDLAMTSDSKIAHQLHLCQKSFEGPRPQGDPQAFAGDDLRFLANVADCGATLDDGQARESVLGDPVKGGSDWIPLLMHIIVRIRLSEDVILPRLSLECNFRCSTKDAVGTNGSVYLVC